MARGHTKTDGGNEKAPAWQSTGGPDIDLLVGVAKEIASQCLVLRGQRAHLFVPPAQRTLFPVLAATLDASRPRHVNGDVVPAVDKSLSVSEIHDARLISLD